MVLKLFNYMASEETRATSYNYSLVS